jgi:hypothetical protein
MICCCAGFCHPQPEEEKLKLQTNTRPNFDTIRDDNQKVIKIREQPKTPMTMTTPAQIIDRKQTKSPNYKQLDGRSPSESSDLHLGRSVQSVEEFTWTDETTDDAEEDHPQILHYLRNRN